MTSRIFAAGAVALALAGCQHLGFAGTVPTAPAGAQWNMPWQLSLASAASEAQGERTFVAYSNSLGFVKGTRQAIDYLDYPLSSIPTSSQRNRTVEACKGVVEAEAGKLGATRVEAVAGGPDRRTVSGYEGPVAFRILYRKAAGYEVRQSYMTCKVDRRGKIQDAFVPRAPLDPMTGKPVGYASLGR